jgi:hypothetical protein
MFYFLIVGSYLRDEGVHVRPFEAAQTRLRAIV